MRALLRRMQRTGLNRVACAYRTISADALCVIGWAPTILRKVEERAKIYEETHRLQHGRATRQVERQQDPVTFAE